MPLSSHNPTFARPQHFTPSGDKWFCNVCTPLSSGCVDYMDARTAQHHEQRSSEHALNVAGSHVWWDPLPTAVVDWGAPIKEDPPLTVEEMKMRESRMHVDHVQDMVPFWIKGVEAAENGEVLRLEEFLESLQEASDSWLKAEPTNPWMDAGSKQEWGKGAWCARSDRAGWGAEGGDRIDGWDPTDTRKAWGQDTKSIASAVGSISRPESLVSWGRAAAADISRPRKRKAGGSRKGRGGKLSGRSGGGTDVKTYEFVEDIARKQAADSEQTRRMHTFFDMPTDEKVRKIDEVIRCLRTVRD